MKSGDYYLEFRRKSFEFEQHFGNPTAIKTNFENNEDNLLTDYELVINEDLDESTESNFVDFQHNSESESIESTSKYSSHNPVITGHSEKLSINLGVEQIALKSQTAAKLNKSIAQETETEQTQLSAAENHTRQKAQQQQQHHLPLTFTIVPIDVAHAAHASGNDVQEFPEIVLNSFKTTKRLSTRRETIAATTTTPITTTKSKKPTSVTFCTTFKPNPSKVQALNEQQHKVAAIIHPNMLPLSPAPPEVVSTDTATDGKKLHELYDDNEFNSQPGSSTSPESYVDNILSAASSVSVRSSSLSSGPEIMHFLAGVGRIGTATAKATTTSADSSIVTSVGGFGGGGGGVAKAKQPLQQQLQRMSAKTMPANRSLNSKATALNNMSTTRKQVVGMTSNDGGGGRGADGGIGGSEQRHQYLHTTLQPPANDAFETISNSTRSPTPSQSISVRVTTDPTLYPEDLKCSICNRVFSDPRTLNCLHSFCFQCLVDENFKQDSSIPFWSQPGADDADWKIRKNSNSLKSSKESSPELSLSNIASSVNTTPLQRQRSSFSFRNRKSIDKALMKFKSDGRSSSNSSPGRQSTTLINSTDDKTIQRTIRCKLCSFSMEVPLGGLRQLPKNFLIVRKIEELKLKIGDDVLTQCWCSLCFEETNATYHCITCTINLCTLCKEAHERQRTTADHKIKNILELRRARQRKQSILNDNEKFTLKCGMHPGFEMKAFCVPCRQLACSDCLVLLHKGHKHDTITRAFINFSKALRESTDQTRPLCSYAQHSMERLNEITKNINQRCDHIQAEVTTFMAQYFEAVEVHRKTLLQQVQRARESKVEMILEQQLELEKRTAEAIDAIRFSQELADVGSNVELLSFVNILLKRFEYCSQFKAPQDPKISDSLHFLPNLSAPSTKSQNNIPLFGIITMQMVEPSLCTLDTEAYAQLRLHKKAELVMQSRDADGVALCHGGLELKTKLKYKECSSKTLPVEVSDHRDGTYGISFVPDAHGTMLLTITINDKQIKGSPFSLLARSVQPHSGIFHCCAFCSSKGSKLAKCSCEGRMPGYNGCGHGHTGHPGRRHWSCCGNILQNSECTVANKLLNL